MKQLIVGKLGDSLRCWQRTDNHGKTGLTRKTPHRPGCKNKTNLTIKHFFANLFKQRAWKTSKGYLKYISKVLMYLDIGWNLLGNHTSFNSNSFELTLYTNLFQLGVKIRIANLQNKVLVLLLPVQSFYLSLHAILLTWNLIQTWPVSVSKRLGSFE